MKHFPLYNEFIALMKPIHKVFHEVRIQEVIPPPPPMKSIQEEMNQNNPLNTIKSMAMTQKTVGCSRT